MKGAVDGEGNTYITAAENIGEIILCEFSVNGGGDVVFFVSKIRPWSSFWVIFITSGLSTYNVLEIVRSVNISRFCLGMSIYNGKDKVFYNKMDRETHDEYSWPGALLMGTCLSWHSFV